VRKELWLFLAKLAVFTLVLGYIWFKVVQRQYPELIEPVAAVFFQLTAVRRWWLVLLLEHYTNLVPYIALVLATPGLITNWKRSLIALTGGLAILILVHLVMATAVYHLVAKYALSRTCYKFLVPIYLVNDALPLVLWILFFPRVLPEMFRFSSFRDRAYRQKG
jgi:hypothetical protein